MDGVQNQWGAKSMRCIHDGGSTFAFGFGLHEQKNELFTVHHAVQRLMSRINNLILRVKLLADEYGWFAFITKSTESFNPWQQIWDASRGRQLQNQ